MIIPDREPGKERIVTGHERLVPLPRSAGYPSADLRAAKKALRRKSVTTGSETVGTTIRLYGGDTAFDGSIAQEPLLLLGLGASMHMEILAQDEALSLHLYSDGTDVPADMEKMVLALQKAVDDYGHQSALGSDPFVWISSDFPLAELKPGALSKLAVRYPDIETVQALTPGQTGMVFHSFADPDSAVYGLNTTIRLAPGFDLGRLEAAFAALVERHGILRTSFDWTLGEQPLQIVHRNAKLNMEIRDWRGLDEDTYAVRLTRCIAADRATPIDLTKAPAMRATVVLGPDGGADLLWCVHHAAVDGWSLPVLLRELAHLYDGMTGLPVAELPDAQDFAAYLAWIAGRDRAAALEHWKSQVGDLSAGTDLVIGSGIATESGVCARHAIQLDFGTISPLLEKARFAGVTPSTLIQGAWAALLARYNQSEDQIFGVTVSGRSAEISGIEEAVGPFVNVLPLRLRTCDGDPLWDWLRNVQETHARNDRHNEISFADIQALSALPAGERLCDSMLVVQNFPMDNRLLGPSPAGGLQGDNLSGFLQLVRAIDGYQTTSYALTIFALPQNDRLEIEFVYDAGRFDAACISALGAHFTMVLKSMITAETLGAVDIIDADGEAGLLALARGPHPAVPEAPSALAMFELQADSRPDAPALVQDGHVTTCGEIEAGANRVAAVMTGHGIGRGSIVAIHMDRTPAMVMALLAVWKAGAAWLPLDPAYPADRLAYMLEDSGAALVLRDGLDLAFRTALPSLDVPSLLASGGTATRPVSIVKPEDLACLIYTSGSSGRPKGVRALHRGLMARLTWGWHAVPFQPEDVAVLKTALPFVDSVSEIFSPLAFGLPAVVVSVEDSGDIGRLVSILAEGSVTRIVLVPSLLRAILDMPEALAQRLKALRTWIVSGEACTAELVAAFRKTFPGARLINFYGSSEVAGDVTWYDTTGMVTDDPAAPVPIGRPVDGNDTFILDRRLKLMPPMMPGELYVSGTHLADGYHEKPDLTAEAFLPSPFGPGRMFRTRDWARWNANGLLEYLGRQDSQIKIRGMRVEMGEVESVLRSLSGVEDAVVRPVAAAGKTLALAAYWSGPATADDLKGGMNRQLATYMVPQYWIRLENLPKLPNGKIDRRSLPDPLGRSDMGGGFVNTRPEGLIEELLLPAWSTMLGVDERELAVTEDFFALGGHSLVAARALAEIARRTGITLRLRQFYEASSLRGVAAHIEAELLAGVTEDELAGLVAQAGTALKEEGSI